MKVQWWEKTVEYRFASEISIRNSGDLVAPLDGHHEQAGDALFANAANRWLLIEFKRDEKQLNSEATKFFDYGRAANELGPVDAHHILMFGSLGSGTSLRLSSCTYFSRTPKGSLDEALDSGISIADFRNYIIRLIELKRGPIDGGGGPSSIEALKFQTVLGVSVSRDIVATMSLGDFEGAFASPNMKPPTQRHFKSRGM